MSKTVKILNSNELHNNKQGEVTYIDDDIITVKLDNGRSFNYDKNQVQKIEEGVEEGVEEKTTLEEDKFFNLYQSFNNLYGINKMNPSELIEFINDLKKMNRISDKDFNVMNDYANKWQDLINKTGYESNIVDESKEVKTEDQYEAERRRGVPPIKRIAEQEVYDNEEWYKEHINDYLDITDFGLYSPEGINYILWGARDNGDGNIIPIYKDTGIIPEVTVTPNGNYIKNTYDNIIYRKKGGTIHIKEKEV